VLRASVNASESKLQIERSAQTQLGRQVKALEDENARLKEDLAFFENLIPSEHRDNTLLINRFRVDPGALPGEFRYRLLLLRGGRRDKPFQGNLQLLVTLQQAAKMLLSRSRKKGKPRLIRSVSSTSSGSRARSACHRTRVSRWWQVRIFETGSAQARATQSFNLS